MTKCAKCGFWRQNGPSNRAFTRKSVIRFFWYLAWSYIIVKGNWWRILFFLENIQFWDFAYWRLSICEKMRFLIIPWPLKVDIGWNLLWMMFSLQWNDCWLVLNVFVLFFLSLCANKRLYIGSIKAWAWPGIPRQEEKSKVFFSSSTQNGPIRKFNMFKPPNSNILKNFPSIVIFSQKNWKLKIIFHLFKMVQFVKLTCLNCQIPIFGKISLP